MVVSFRKTLSAGDPKFGPSASPIPIDPALIVQFGRTMRETSLLAQCACRKSNSNILVMQPAQDRTAKYVTDGSNGARYGRVLL